MGRCGGDGRRLHAHEAGKLAIKRLVLNNPTPAGCVFPRESVIIEPTHLRQDKSRLGDIIYAMGTGMHRKDCMLDVVVTSALQRSCLSQTSKSSDRVVRKVEKEFYFCGAYPDQFY